MDKNIRSEKSLIMLTIIIVLLILISYYIINNFNKTANIRGQLDENVLDPVNYVASYQGDKVNMSTKVVEDKRVGNIAIERSQIVYNNGISKLTSKVTNSEDKKDNLRFSVEFLANDGTVIAKSIGFVGKIDTNETKYIDSYVTYDVSNSSNIVYELME